MTLSKNGFRIQTKIALLSTALICAVVAGIAATLIWVQQRQLRGDFSARIDAMMSGVERIAAESLAADDEIMLLSYLKQLMKDYPELELALVSRAGHTSVLGAVRTRLYYRTITASEGESAAYRTAAAGRDKAAGADGAALSARGGSIPPGTLVIQLGLSKTALDSQIDRAVFSMISKVLTVAGIGLLLGFLASWLLSRRLAKPVVELTASIQSVASGKKPEELEIDGDEIAYLKVQYDGMVSKIMGFIRLKDELLMTLTHELNNPLAGLKALVAMLSDPSAKLGPAAAGETYKIMADAISAMELSLSNALEMFKMGHAPALKLKRVDLAALFGQVFRLFRPVAQSGGIDLRAPVIRGEACLDGDEELLRRVLVNLVSNACKYTPPGGTVRLSLEDSPAEISLSVADTGPGIAPGDRELIFDRFYRVPEADGKARKIPGSGLGLAITKQAVELHRGRIWVESAEGQGSVFRVTLPKDRGNYE